MRTRRAVLSFSTGSLLTLVALIVGFVTTPYLLKWLGAERFGAFRAASDWFAYLALLELGLSGSLLALLAKAVANASENEIRTVIAAGLWWYLRLALVMMAIGLVLAVFITDLIPVTPSLHSDLRRGTLTGLIGFSLVALGTPFKLLIESRQRAYWINGLLLVQSLVITGSTLLLAYHGWGITGQFLGVVAGAVIFNVPLVWSGLRKYPGIIRTTLLGRPDATTQVEIRRLNVPTFLFNFASQLSLQTDTIIVSIVIGPASVVPLFITQKLIVMLQGQMQGIGNASWAAFAELHLKGQFETFNDRLVELTSFVAALSVSALVPIAIYNRHFVELWVGAQHYGSDAVSFVSAANAFLLSLFSLWGWCFSGTGRLPLLLPAFLAQTLINVTLSVYLAHTVGIVGPLVGSFAGFVGVSLWYLPKLLAEQFRTPIIPLVTAVVAPVALAIPYGLALWWIADRYPPNGWLILFGHVGSSISAFLLFGWPFILNGKAKLRVHSHLQRFGLARGA